MTNVKTTKRALLASVMSLLLCISMLIGSTFAWFTDTASTGVNTIQAGTLDVALVDAEGKSLEGKTLEFKKAEGAPADEKILWEPGCTYTLRDVYVQNNGNLKLKYTVVISGINGAAKLNEAITWTITGTGDGILDPNTKSNAIQISGHMKENAGNEYQGLSITGISIAVYATQVEGEFDSIGNDYDKNANFNYTGKKHEPIGPNNVKMYVNDGTAAYNEANKTYTITSVVVGQGGWNAGQNNYYSGYTVDVTGYAENATVKFNEADGTEVTWKLADEEDDGFITGTDVKTHQQWTAVGKNSSYRYDIDGDGVTDFTVTNNVADAKVEVSNEAELIKVIGTQGVSAVLISDIELNKAVSIAADKAVTLDLNGYDLDIDMSAVTAEPYSAITVSKGSSFTINGNGNVHFTAYQSDNKMAAMIHNNAGTVTINGGTYTLTAGTYDEGYLIPCFVDNSSNIGDAILNINGGNFTFGRNLIRNHANSGTHSTGYATININGGTFNGMPGDDGAIWSQRPISSVDKNLNYGVIHVNGGTFNGVVIDNEWGESAVTVKAGVVVTVNN